MAERRANAEQFEADQKKRIAEEEKRKAEIQMILKFDIKSAVDNHEEKVRTMECVKIWSDYVTEVQERIMIWEEEKRIEREEQEALRKAKELELFNSKNINPSNSKFALNVPKAKPKPKKKKKDDFDLF